MRNQPDRRRAPGRPLRNLLPALFLACLAAGPRAWLGRSSQVQEEEQKELPVMYVDFVELQVPVSSGPGQFQITKLYVPIVPEVASWMNETSLEFSYSAESMLTGPQRIHVTVLGEPFEISNTTVRGVHTVMELPDQVTPEACKVAVIPAEAELGGKQHLGPTHVLLLLCKVHPTAKESFQNSQQILLAQGHPLRWLLLPWLLLLLPFIVGSSLGPFALLGGAALTLASIACLSFLIAILIVIVQRRCLHCTRRWRRLWRLRVLQRRPKQIDTAFGDSGPCCICLGEADSRDALIALLPCRHALHAECYANWVSADAYPSSNLICPVCRCGAEAIGKLSSLRPPEV